MEHDHIVKSFDDDLGHIDAIIAEMGGLAERQLADAVTALCNRDAELAQRVIDGDKRLDALEGEIDNFTIRVLALRQPMAEDLRAVIVALKMAANLERIGDYAKNVAKRTLILATMEPVAGTAASVQRMAAEVQSMIKNVLDAYGTRDIAKADDVRLRDEDVDQMHTSLFRELLTYMMEDPRSISRVMNIIWSLRSLERIGDHARNIAEHVIYVVKGKDVRHVSIKDLAREVNG